MKIRVSYSELRSENFNNRSAQAEVEIDVADRHLDEVFAIAWGVVKREVRSQLDGNDIPAAERLRELERADVIPL